MSRRDRQRLADIEADTSHAVLNATVDHDLPVLEQAVHRLIMRVRED